jgi:DNA-directed RNA polymerase II subunit RPB2
VNTSFSKYFHGDKISNGINSVVAILCYTGYNQEDSVIISQSSIDRGFFNSVFYRSYKDDEKKIQSSGQEEKFANPAQIDSLTGDRKYDITIGKKREMSYKNLDEHGFIKENVYVYPGDIIIGKIIPIRQQDKSITKVVYRDISTPIRTNEEGFVDRVYESRNSEGFRFCKVKIRSIRIPTVGDKFCLAGSCNIMTEIGFVNINMFDFFSKDKEALIRLQFQRNEYS